MKLLTEGKANTKLAKGRDSDYETVGLFLAPHTLNGQGVNLCPFASKSCVAACLNTAGLAGVFPKIIQARIRKAQWYLEDRHAFINQLEWEIMKAEEKATRHGKKLAVRLNGTSDIKWPDTIMLHFPRVQFYDYTKDPYKMRRYLNGLTPSNYHLTFSYSGENLVECQTVLGLKGNVTVVFSSSDFPTEWNGVKVISGENTDFRFLDERGVVVGLKAKGKAKNKEVAGSFVIQIDKKVRG